MRAALIWILTALLSTVAHAQTLTQRRAGLITLHAVTAAGRGRYEVLDVGVDRGLELVGDVTPGLLTPFLVDGRGAGRLVRR